jgi:bifunctional ADP-heptose synthase (sugar kinase/adenylyltransferase)
LDSRTKIASRGEIEARLEDRPAIWVSGYFDPLLAEHVRLLSQARRPGRALVVEVANPARPLLAQRARAELVAALAAVDFVMLGDSQNAIDTGITERFSAHVLARHRQEQAPMEPAK